MISQLYISTRRRTTRLTVCAVFLLVTACHSVKGQPPPPPKPITVYANPAQGLMFGAFFGGPTGGTVIVNPDGSRSVTGSLMAANLGHPFSPAVFEIEASAGTAISIMNGPDVILTGSRGGSVTLHVGASNKGPSFITTVSPPSRTQVMIGGTLTVGNALSNPSGNYSGTFSVTFIQQ